jgi:hypothetical protein
MKNLFVPYKQALELKELGFDEECLGDYFEFNDLNQKLKEDIQLCITQDDVNEYTVSNSLYPFWSCSAPLWQQAFDWFRNEYNLCSWIYKSASRPYKYHYSILKDARVYVESDNNKSTYEEARLECLKNLIEIVKNK